MFYNVHDILYIKNAFPKFVPNFFMIGEKDLMRSRDCDLIVRPINHLPSNLVEVASSTYQNPEDGSVIYSMRTGIFHIAWSLRNLEGFPTEVGISPGYRLWSDLIKVPVGGILPVEIYLKVIMHLKLLLKGYAFLIASCIIPCGRNRAVLVCAPNAMGKTSVALDFVTQYKAHLVADDTVIVDCDNNLVLSYPQLIRRRIGILKSNSVPFTERYNDPESLFEMKHSTQADMVFLLERATTNTVKKVTVEDGLAKLIAINQKILSYQSENTIIWYASSNPCFKIDSMLSKERHILSKFSKDKEFFLVQYRNSTYQASELIRKTLGVG